MRSDTTGPPRTVDTLCVAHLIESDGPGGAERVVAIMARTLQSAGARNVVFLPAGGEGWLARELDGSGVAVEPFPMRRRCAPDLARSLANAFRRHGVGVAHSHEFFMALYGAWAARLARVPHVITMHGGGYYADRLRRRLALRTACSLSARTVAVSRPLAETMKRYLWMAPQRIGTIPNGVAFTPAKRETLRAELGLAPDDRLLVAIGNLYPVKGHLHLVAALGLLTRTHPRLHLAIAGRGETLAGLEEAAREAGVSDRLHLLGLRSDTAALLAAADIFVLPSLSEGLPLALLEAMFAGCPIVASDVGDVGVALAQGSAGMLVPPGNPRALAAAIETLLLNPDRARELGTRASTRAATEYSATAMVSRYIELYGDLSRPRFSFASPCA
jgi:glycosyltransferase involved in cell wall biosynthesis